MTKPSEIFDTPEADSRVGGNEEIVEEFVEFYGDFFDEYICCAGHGCNCGGKVSLPAVKTWLRTILTTKDQEKEEAIGRILALKINMPAEKEYSTNPTSAYRTGFEQAVSMYRDRIRSLTHRG